jgi:hypothetical protein
MGAEPGGIDPVPIGKTRSYMTRQQEQILDSQPILLPERLKEDIRRRRMEDDDSRI